MPSSNDNQEFRRSFELDLVWLFETPDNYGSAAPGRMSRCDLWASLGLTEYQHEGNPIPGTIHTPKSFSTFTRIVDLDAFLDWLVGRNAISEADRDWARAVATLWMAEQ
jgi:hypothetical protein